MRSSQIANGASLACHMKGGCKKQVLQVEALLDGEAEGGGFHDPVRPSIPHLFFFRASGCITPRHQTCQVKEQSWRVFHAVGCGAARVTHHRQRGR